MEINDELFDEHLYETGNKSSLVPKKINSFPTKNKDVIEVKGFVVKGNKLYKLVKKEDTGEWVERELAYATLVDSVEKNLETKEVMVNLKYYSYDDWESISIDRGKLVKTELKNLLKYGIDMGGYKTNDVLEFIDKHEKLAPKIYTHGKLGWYQYDDRLIFRHKNAYQANGKPFSNYNGPLQIGPKGTLEGWMNTITEYVIGHTPLEMILSASFAATIVGLLNVTEVAEVDTFLLNMVANSTTGKTTAAMVAASAFGSPSITNNGLLQSFNGTANALQSILSGNMGVPLIYDETSMNMLGKKEFSSLIYKFAQNKDKARLNKEADLRSTEKWATAIFFTGEASILENANANEGLHVRLFEFKKVPWTKSAEHAEAIKDKLLNNYGHAGIKYVQYILSRGPEEVKYTWQKFQRMIAKEMPNSKFVSRVGSKFSLVLTGAHYANEALGLNLSIENIMQMLVEQEEESMTTRELSPKFYEMLRQYIIENKRNFKWKDQDVNSSQKIYGKIVYENGKSYCYILTLRLKEITNELGFPDLNILLDELKKEGHLKHDKDKRMIKKKVFNEEEKELRERSLGNKKYPSKGDYTHCVIYDGDIFEGYNNSNGYDPSRSPESTRGRKTSSNEMKDLFNDE